MRREDKGKKQILKVDPMKMMIVVEMMTWLEMVLLVASLWVGMLWTGATLNCLSDIWEKEALTESRSDNVVGPGNTISSVATRSHTTETECFAATGPLNLTVDLSLRAPGLDFVSSSSLILSISIISLLIQNTFILQMRQVSMNIDIHEHNLVCWSEWRDAETGEEVSVTYISYFADNNSWEGIGVST